MNFKKTKFPLRLFFLIVYGLIFTGKVGAADYSVYKSLLFSQIVANQSINLTNNVPSSQFANLSEIHKESYTTVKLFYNRQLHTDVLSGLSWILNIHYRLSWYNEASQFISSSEYDLTIDNDKHVESLNKHFAAGFKLKCDVLSVTASDFTGTTINVQDLPSDILLECGFISEVYQTPAQQEMKLNISPSADNLLITWTFLPGAEEYQLEYVFISKNDIRYNQIHAYNLPNPFLYKEPVRISTNEQFYSLSNTYSKGDIFFRVRGVSKMFNEQTNDFTHSNFGYWNYLDDDNAVASVVFDDGGVPPLEKDRNWEISKTYAENGKYKEIVKYYDENLRMRQAVTNLSTDNNIAVAETKYDYEGRPTVQMLPAPIRSNSLSYRAFLNTTASATNVFDKDDFDVLSNDATNFPVINATSGASKYYSENNDVPGINRDFIPDADGYVYSMVRYKRDNTGRPEMSSGVGQIFKMGGGRETKYFYDNPTSTELKRLFGENVGSPMFYKRVYTVDPNKQTSVAYLNQAEQTIATALVGECPSNLIALNEPADADITADLCPVDNDPSHVDYNKILDKTFTNLIPTTYQFEYDVTPLISNMCERCRYDLEISIHNPDGLPLLNGAGTAVDGLTLDITSLPFFCEYNPGNGKISCDLALNESQCTTDIGNKLIKFDAYFTKQGEYHLFKELKLVPKVFDASSVSSVEINGQNYTHTQLLDKYQSDVSIESCLLPCDCGNPADPHYKECWRACMAEKGLYDFASNVASQECNSLLVKMQKQIKPFNVAVSDPATFDEDYPGYYFGQQDLPSSLYYHFEVGGDMTDVVFTNASHYDIAIAKSSNQLSVTPSLPSITPSIGAPEGYWDRVKARYDGAGFVSTPFASFTIGANSYSATSTPAVNSISTWYDVVSSKANSSNPQDLQDLKTAWKDEWTTLLVQCHPEYVHYEACIAYNDSREYDLLLGDIPDWLSAMDKGALDPLKNELGNTINYGTSSAASFGYPLPFPSSQTALNASFDDRLVNSVNDLKYAIDPFVYNINTNATNSFATSFNQSGFVHSSSSDLNDPLSVLSTLVQNYTPDFPVGGTCDDVIINPESIWEIANENRFSINTHGTISGCPATANDKFYHFTQYISPAIQCPPTNPNILMPEVVPSDYPIEERRWQIFRGLYIKQKREALKKMVLSALPTNADYGSPNEAYPDAYLDPDGYVRFQDQFLPWAVFTTPYEVKTPEIDASDPVGSATDLANNNFNTECENLCMNFAEIWTSKVEALRLPEDGPTRICFDPGILTVTESLNEIETLKHEFYTMSFNGCVDYYNNVLGLSASPTCTEPASIPTTFEPYQPKVTNAFLEANSNITDICAISCLENASDNCFDRVGAWLANVANACPSLSQTNLDELRPLLENICSQNSNIFTVVDISKLSAGDPGFDALTDFLNDANHPCSITINQVASRDLCNSSPTLFTGSLIRFLNQHVLNNGINLTATSPSISFPSVSFHDEFESGISSGWGAYSKVAVGNACGSLCTNSLYFNGAATSPSERYIATGNLNVTGGGLIAFDLKVPTDVPNGDYKPCDLPSDGSSIALQYKLTPSSNWVTIATYYQQNFRLFNHVSLQIPAAAMSSATQFRWVQKISNPKEENDVWILDNVSFTNSQTIADQGLLASLDANSLTMSFVNNDGKIGLSGTGRTRSIDNCSPSLLCSPWIYIRQAVSPYAGITLSTIVSIDNYYVDFTGKVILDLTVNTGGENQTVKGWLFAESSCVKLTDCIMSASVQSEGCVSALFDQANMAGEDAWNDAIAAQASLEALNYNNNCSQNLVEDFQVTFPIKEYHYTLYYYDQAGNLVQTVPPAGFQPWPTSTSDHTLKTNYQYNSQNQVVRQITPDGGETKFLYDAAQRLRISESEKQNANNSFSYTKYDPFGRIIEVAELQNQTNLFSVLTQQQINNQAFPDYFAAGVIGLNSLTRTYYETPYTLASIGSNQKNLRNRISYVEYFDGITYNSQGINFSNSTNKSAIAYNYDEVGNVKNLWNLVDLNKIKKVDYDYDLISGKVNKVIYQPGSSDQFIHKYDYDADNRLTNVYTSQDGLLWDEDGEYFYYPHGPLAREELGQDKVQGRDYVYTLQGWMKSINLPNFGEANIIEPGKDGSVSAYNVNNYFPKDEFGSILGYYENDYKGSVLFSPGYYTSLMSSTLLTDGTHPGKPLYNGNIGMIANSVAPGLDGTGVSFASDAGASGILNFYSYDQLNRLKEYRPYKSTFNSTNSIVSIGSRTTGNNSFDETYSYDPNGNIMSLVRFGTSNASPMHSFKYTYATADVLADGIGSETSPAHLKPGNNKLWHVTNAGISADGFPTTTPVFTRTSNAIPDDPHHLAITNGNYKYDEIGNLIKDEAAEIKNIEWNVGGKITKIERTSGSTKPSLEFCYDPMGNRVMKIVKPYNAANESEYDYTYYYRDAQGNILGTEDISFAKGRLIPTGPLISDTKTDLEWPIYGSSRLGVKRKTEFYAFDLQLAIDYHGDYSRVLENKTYELNNHLGNVMATITDHKFGHDNGTGHANYYTAQISSAQDYYPFGSVMPGRSYSTPSYRYGFNGKEKDDEVSVYGDQYDYGFRIYNPRLGRFLSVDPLAYKFSHWTPFQFTGNSPIRFIDLDGLETPNISFMLNTNGWDNSRPTYKLTNKDKIAATAGVVLPAAAVAVTAPAATAALLHEGYQWLVTTGTAIYHYFRNPENIDKAGRTAAQVINPNPIDNAANYTIGDLIRTTPSQTLLQYEFNKVTTGFAELEKDGSLAFAFEVGPFKNKGLGSSMFKDAVTFFGDKVKSIKGMWVAGDNLNAFKKAIADGVSPKEAALNYTFTGSQAKANGFINVAEPTITKDASGEIIKVTTEFTKQ